MAETSTGPTGRRFALSRGEVTAQINQVGASLRALTVAGVDLVPTYPDAIATPAASGVVLVPWPNRIRGGEWTQRGVTRQLAITEPALGNASHGLLRFTPYTPSDQSDAGRLTLAADVFPQTGYPFHLATSVTYALTDRGIEVTHEIANVGEEDAPVALGVHPYLQIGGVPTGDLSITVAGTRCFAFDAHKIPVAEVAVDDATDLRAPRRIGDVSLDTAYTDLVRDADGRVSGRLEAPDGRSVEIWADESFPLLQVFTTDRYPGYDVAVAIEPMTAPANALATGDGLRWLSPGESWRLSWGIDAVMRP